MALGKFIEEIMKEYFEAKEIISRKIKKYGTGAHISMPKKYLDKEVKIIIPKDKNKQKEDKK